MNILSSVSAGKGNTGVASSGDVSLIYLNPATLNISKKFQVNAGYNLKSESSITLSQNFYSFSFAGAYRINKDFQVGLAYQNDYSYEQNSTYLFQENYFNNKLETHSFRVPVVYQHKWLRFGMNINLSYYKASYEQDVTGSFWKLIPEIGTVITPIKEFSFGASFIPGFQSNFQYKTDNTILIDKPFAKYPDRIKIGTEIRTANNDTKFTFDYHYANTSNIGGLRDQNDFHFGFEHLLDENWAFRCGLFSNRSLYDNRTFFLTFGTSFKFHNYSFNLAGLVSMAGNSGSEGYYVLNFGAGYEF
jgi:long-subunit fatty acid transport protein